MSYKVGDSVSVSGIDYPVKITGIQSPSVYFGVYYVHHKDWTREKSEKIEMPVSFSAKSIISKVGGKHLNKRVTRNVRRKRRNNSYFTMKHIK